MPLGKLLAPYAPQSGIDFFQVELLRIEVLAQPLYRVTMIGVFGIKEQSINGHLSKNGSAALHSHEGCQH